MSVRGYPDLTNDDYGGYGRPRRSRRRRQGRGAKTPALAIGAGAVSVAVIAAAVVGSGHLFGARSTATAATPNPNCTLIVPANPLTAQGLATPYQLTATNPAAGPCNEANPNQTAFVQGAVLDPATGQISVYNPLVVDAGTQPAVTPTAPTLPAGAVVATWFGFNGTTLSFEGADQAALTTTATPTAAATTPTAAAATTPAATPTSTVAAATPTAAATTPAATATSTVAAATPTAAATSPAAAATPTAAVSATATAALQAFIRQDGHHHGHRPTATATPTATMTTAPTSLPTAAATTTSSAATTTTTTGTLTAPTVTGTQPPAGTDTPAASGTPDAILQQSNCVAGENIAGTFSSFTQVGACNAVAFFQAANSAVQAGKLTVPNPGTATDGQPCETTRNFAVIDQDQSDNVTTMYLANANGQIAQDTAANAQTVASVVTLANGSDNGLIDFHVDPALGCTPWTVPDLANPGASATALPLDELQAAAFAGQSGGPAALVPLNDPMTLDNNGNQSTDKANTYRSIVDQTALPTGETPAEYCGDMESIQGVRLQQDVNLLIGQASPLPALASNLFNFLGMRLQQSFANLNCQNFGLKNDVSTTVDGNGVTVAVCFLQQVNAVTAGAGNPTAGMTVCPATTTAATPTAAATSTAAATPTATGATAPATIPATPTATGATAPTTAPTFAPAPTATGTNGAGPTPGGNAGTADRKHQHWWY